MKLYSSNPPHIRNKDTNRTLMSDVIIVLLFNYAMAYYFYGPRVIYLAAVSVVSAVAAGLLCHLIAMRRPNLRDLSTLVTALILPLLMPASVNPKVLVAAVLFAIVVAKFPFGGTGNNLFNPAAAGFAFAAISWPSHIFTYPTPLEHLPVFGELAFNAAQSPLRTLRLGGIPTQSLSEMLLGNFPGPMGCTNILVLLACLLFLAVRGTIRWQMPVSFLAAAALFALFLPRAGLSGVESIGYELMSGSLLFGAIFMLTDPVTSPKRLSAKIVYSVIAGMILMAFRRFGASGQMFAFALLLMNAFTPVFDLLTEEMLWKGRRALRAAGKNQKLQ